MSIMTNTKMTTRREKTLTTQSIVAIGMLAAVASILMLFEISLWFAPFFYKLDFSEIPVLIGAFALGPIAGIVIELVKVLVNLLLNGTITMGVGEFANFAIGCSFIIPASIIYKAGKTKKSALYGLIVGTLSMTILGSFLNAVVILPAFSFFTKTPMESLIAIGTGVNSAITDLTTFIILAVAPFNLVKGVVSSFVAFLLYKRLSVIIKAFTK